MLLSCYASMTCHLHITCWKLQEDGKKQAREAVRTYWLNFMLTDARHKRSTRFLNKDTINYGRLHRVWYTTPHRLHDITQACIKAKIIAGSYRLQVDEARQRGVTATCIFCKVEGGPGALHHSLPIYKRCTNFTHIQTKTDLLSLPSRRPVASL